MACIGLLSTSTHVVLIGQCMFSRLGTSAFCTGFSRLELPEQALDGIPPGLGLVVKINLLNFHVSSRLRLIWMEL